MQRMQERYEEKDYEIVVVGGGMAGLCCAIAAARHGIKVVLVHDRPVLGGNASSEIRMWIGGAYINGASPAKDIRESGIIEEIFLENFYQNPAK